MSVPNQTPYIIYNANGMTTVFPFEFYIINANDIQISLNGEVISSGYSVSGVGNIAGGDVIFLTPPANGTVVMLERVVPTYRLTDYQDNGDLLADTVNKDFDRLWMAIQRYGIHLGLALKRPLFGGPFDAEGYRISNLEDPVNDQDAATKKYVESVSLARTLRVPENTVQAVPSVSMRANKLLAFNAAGDPIAVLPASGSASDVLIELAKPTGAGLSGTTSGGTVQTDLDKLNTQNGAFAYIEDYANLVVGDDWTAAVQASFDTGKEVIGIKGKQYKVTSIINSKGQRISGEFIINTTRYSLGNVLASSETQVSYSEKLRICYVESAYDLSELLYIKSLGFNAINHYCYFNNNGSIDSGGTVTNLLDNAYTAGLGVILGTESPSAISDLTGFITSSTNHPAVIGYSVYDEPGARGISVADQESKIATMRSATHKSLSMVDQLPAGGGPFEQAYSTKYDLVLCNSYSLNRSGLSLDDAVEEDLIHMRLDYGGIGKMVGTTRVIPVVAAFSGSGFGTVAQMLKAGDIFGQAGNGEYGAFVWDGVGDSGITARIRDTQSFRELVKGLAAKIYVKPFVTEAYLFGGGSATGMHWSLDGLMQKIMPKDAFSSDGLITNNAWPTRIITGDANSDHTTTQASVKVSGIAFKGASSALATTIRYRKGFGAWVQMIALNGGASINGSVIMGATEDGYFEQDATNTPITSAAPFKFGMKNAIAEPIKGRMSTILFSFPSSTTTIYRNLMRGLIVYADW
ncbi:phage tail fiber protein [Enterobacter hormaechei]|uniref:phage tail fiber domain-containing protein n=1 Tax=Enterobacter hormaechei TaxID=158836 RepID=UPI002044DAD4|nr:phage tail fiber protein [Enterobacter hormaechei]